MAVARTFEGQCNNINLNTNPVALVVACALANPFGHLTTSHLYPPRVLMHTSSGPLQSVELSEHSSTSVKHAIEATCFSFNIMYASSHNIPREPRRNPSNRRLYEHDIIFDTARNRTHDLFRPISSCRFHHSTRPH